MPGAFSRALKDNQYLKPLADSLLAYKQKLDEQEGRKKLLELMSQLKKSTDQSFQTQDGGTSNVAPSVQGNNLPYNLINPNLQEVPNLQNKLGTETQGMNLNVPNQPELTSKPELPFNSKRPDIVKPEKPIVKAPTTFDPKNNAGDYRQATDEIRSTFADILSKAILDPTIDTTKLEQMVKLSEQRIPTAPTKHKYTIQQLGDKAAKIDEYGNVLEWYDTKGKLYDIETPIENETTGTTWVFNKNKGVWEDTKMPYDKKKGKTTVNINDGNDYNYSNLYSNLQEGIKVIKNLKERPVNKKKDGKIEYFEPGSDEPKTFGNQKEFDAYKESIAKGYKNDATKLMMQLGLDNANSDTPVKDIRAYIKEGHTLKESIEDFEKENPDFPKDKLKIMEEYFTLSTM